MAEIAITEAVKSTISSSTKNVDNPQSPTYKNTGNHNIEIKRLRELVNPRKISKEIDPQGRIDTARRMLEAIASKKDLEKQIDSRTQDIKKVTEPLERSLQKDREKMNNIFQKLEEASSKGQNKKVTKLEDEINKISKAASPFEEQVVALQNELIKLQEQTNQIPDPKKLVETYYEKTLNTPLSNEQKRALLRPEVLAGLSETEYIALLKRLNPFFLAHVTRQGFRDHNMMVYHSAGMDQYHEGLKGLVENGMIIRPPFFLRELKTRDTGSLKKWLLDNGVLNAQDEAQAKINLDRLLNYNPMATAPKYPDSTAIHFTAQLVGNEFYGGETNNEIFFMFPSDAIASQFSFAFNGWEKDLTRPQSETKWNDIFVWTNNIDNPGISIDAGLVFLPKSTQVDPETGSKYASELKVVDGKEKRVMIEDKKLIDSFINWGVNLDIQSPLIKGLNILRGTLGENRPIYERNCLNAFVTEFVTLGFCSEAASQLATTIMDKMRYTDITDDVVLNESLKEQDRLLNIIRDARANWKRPEKTISAKEYWDKFFLENPQLRPKHIQYYDGDPTSAVYLFQQQNNIGSADTSKTDGKLLGFEDNYVQDMKTDPRSNTGYEEVISLANQLIEEHFKK